MEPWQSLQDSTEEEDQSTSEMILMNHILCFIFLLSLIKEWSSIISPAFFQKDTDSDFFTGTTETKKSDNIILRSSNLCMDVEEMIWAGRGGRGWGEKLYLK